MNMQWYGHIYHCLSIVKKEKIILMMLWQYTIRVESSLLEALDLLLNQILHDYMRGFCLYLYDRGLQAFYLSYNSKPTRTPTNF
jgi:hypothetical protein